MWICPHCRSPLQVGRQCCEHCGCQLSRLTQLLGNQQVRVERLVSKEAPAPPPLPEPPLKRVASRDHRACRAQAGALSARDPSLCHRLVSTGMVIWRWRRYKLRQYVWTLPELEVQLRFGCTHCNGGTWIDYRWS